jgi:hypothetical protein
MSTRNKEIIFLGSKAGPVRRADNLTSVSRLSRQCGILNISQPYRPPRPVTGIALPYSTLPHSTLFYPIVPYSTLPHSTLPYSTPLSPFYPTLLYATLPCPNLPHPTLPHSILLYPTLHHSTRLGTMKPCRTVPLFHYETKQQQMEFSF